MKQIVNRKEPKTHEGLVSRTVPRLAANEGVRLVATSSQKRLENLHHCTLLTASQCIRQHGGDTDDERPLPRLIRFSHAPVYYGLDRNQ